MNTHDKLKLAAELGVELPHYTNTDNPIDFPVRGADRIKELAQQAGLIAPYGSDHEGLRDFDWREFSKLIVKECIGVVADAEELREPASTYVEKIETHFGLAK
jgi:hypothetical protein